MALFAVTLNDQTIDFVDGADAYQQEGPMTTFFSFSNGRQVVDSWSLRLASYRTADIAAIRRSRPQPMGTAQQPELLNRTDLSHHAGLSTATACSELVDPAAQPALTQQVF